jgi:diguanylate cyclase (GGDEF)-like protein/PAS domain S-box-containing protein
MSGVDRRIMIVEDETIVALDLETRLKTFHFDVVSSVTTGEEAVREAEEKRPDLILMDINLDGQIDGVEAAGTIRRRFGIPIIFLTAWGDQTTLDRAKETEPYGYIIKPFEDRELYSQIEIAIHNHRSESDLRRREERFSLANQGSDDGLWDWNTEKNTIYFSSRAAALLGYTSEELVGAPRDWLERIHPGDRARVRNEIRNHITGDQQHFYSEHRTLHKDGTYRWILAKGLAFRNEDGKVGRMAGSLTDVTDRKLFDPLTGLPNRALFMDRLERSLRKFQREPAYAFAVLALKAQNFGRLSDNLGCAFRDELLGRFVNRLQRELKSEDTVVSLGEESFAILVEEIDNVAAALQVAESIQQRLKKPFHLKGEEVYAKSFIGITYSTSGYRHPEDLLRDAQTAMHRAREHSNSCEIFDLGMRTKVLSRIRLETQLRQALDREQLIVHYQPIVSLKDAALTGFEALVRWQHPDGRLLAPKEFIPLAEEAGLMVPLERWVLDTACRELQRWQKKSNGKAPALSVNFSSEQYQQVDLIEMLEDTLQRTGFPPERLKLEITESAFLKDSEKLTRLLLSIRELGIQLHMDDFGTGYSSLSYLCRLPVTNLKIDKSFISGLELNQETRQIVRAIASLGQSLRLEITAEGIETATQLREVVGLECDYGQGFLFSRPLEPAAAELLIRHPEELKRILEAGRLSTGMPFPEAAAASQRRSNVRKFPRRVGVPRK